MSDPTTGPHPDHAYAQSVERIPQPCRFCGQPIIWGLTNTGKRAPFDAQPDETGRHLNHWVSCPERGKARQRYPAQRKETR